VLANSRRTERLRDIVVGPQLQSQHLIRFLVFAGQHDDGVRKPTARSSDRLEAVFCRGSITSRTISRKGLRQRTPVAVSRRPPPAPQCPSSFRSSPIPRQIRFVSTTRDAGHLQSLAAGKRNGKTCFLRPSDSRWPVLPWWASRFDAPWPARAPFLWPRRISRSTRGRNFWEICLLSPAAMPNPRSGRARPLGPSRERPQATPSCSGRYLTALSRGSYRAASDSRIGADSWHGFLRPDFQRVAAVSHFLAKLRRHFSHEGCRGRAARTWYSLACASMRPSRGWFSTRRCSRFRLSPQCPRSTPGAARRSTRGLRPTTRSAERIDARGSELGATTAETKSFAVGPSSVRASPNGQWRRSPIRRPQTMAPNPLNSKRRRCPTRADRLSDRH